MKKYIVSDTWVGGNISVDVMAENERDAMKKAKVSKTHDICLVNNQPPRNGADAYAIIDIQRKE